jgi:hypothetical protein
MPKQIDLMFPSLSYNDVIRKIFFNVLRCNKIKSTASHRSMLLLLWYVVAAVVAFLVWVIFFGTGWWMIWKLFLNKYKFLRDLFETPAEQRVKCAKSPQLQITRSGVQTLKMQETYTRWKHRQLFKLEAHDVTDQNVQMLQSNQHTVAQDLKLSTPRSCGNALLIENYSQ